MGREPAANAASLTPIRAAFAAIFGGPETLAACAANTVAAGAEASGRQPEVAADSRSADEIIEHFQ